MGPMVRLGEGGTWADLGVAGQTGHFQERAGPHTSYPTGDHLVKGSQCPSPPSGLSKAQILLLRASGLHPKGPQFLHP